MESDVPLLASSPSAMKREVETRLLDEILVVSAEKMENTSNTHTFNSIQALHICLDSAAVFVT